MLGAKTLPKKSEATDNRSRYDAALELERRLYENAVSSVDQTFAKEGLVAAFLTSGTIVAYHGCPGGLHLGFVAQDTDLKRASRSGE